MRQAWVARMNGLVVVLMTMMMAGLLGVGGTIGLVRAQTDGSTGDNANAPAIVLPLLPTQGGCALATEGGDPVNIRALPVDNAGTLGTLSPANVYMTGQALISSEGGHWYGVDGGWVAGWVLRSTPACDDLPILTPLLGDGFYRLLPWDASSLRFQFILGDGSPRDVKLTLGNRGQAVFAVLPPDGSAGATGHAFALGVTGAGQVWVSADPAAQPDATAALDTLSADALIPAEPVLLDVTDATTTDVARLSFDVNGALQLDALPADEASMLFLPILTLTASGTDGAPLNLGIGFDPVTGAFGLTRQIIRLG